MPPSPSLRRIEKRPPAKVVPVASVRLVTGRELVARAASRSNASSGSVISAFSLVTLGAARPFRRTKAHCDGGGESALRPYSVSDSPANQGLNLGGPQFAGAALARGRARAAAGTKRGQVGEQASRSWSDRES